MIRYSKRVPLIEPCKSAEGQDSIKVQPKLLCHSLRFCEISQGHNSIPWWDRDLKFVLYEELDMISLQNKFQVFILSGGGAMAV